MAIELVIFDLDDTLISTQKIYTDAKAKAASRMEILGVDFEKALKAIEKTDMERTRVLGTNKNRFPMSLLITYNELCKKYGWKHDSAEAKKITDIGYSVFDTPSETFEFSKSVLEEFYGEIPMIILTRGDKEVQAKRIVQSGLAEFFDQFFIVDVKTPEFFLKLCRFYDVEPNNAIMVGNSVYGDIYPALEAGLFGFHVRNGTYELDGAYSISPEDHDRMSFGPDITSFRDYLIGELDD